MKIALVFSGQPRFVKEMLIYQINRMMFLNKYNCDVYAHFWFSKDENQKYITAPATQLGNLSFDKDTIDLFSSLYSPKKLMYENPPLPEDFIKREYTRCPDKNRLYIFFSYLTSLKKSYDLIENPDQYDFIIRMRTDLLICRLPDLHTISKDHIHIFDQKQGNGSGEKSISDCFYMVPPKYAHFLFHQLDVADTLYNMGCRIDGGSEDLLEMQLKINNLYEHSKILHINDFYYRFQRNGRTVHGLIGMQDEKPENL
jgi:hypothetical protein